MRNLFICCLVLLVAISFNACNQQVKLQTVPDSALNFMVASDMGRRGLSQQLNVAAIMGQLATANKISLIAVAGDPIHDNGVKSTEDTEWKKKFENVYTAASLQNIPWYVVSGNHEYHGSVPAILKYSGHSTRWKAPARYYSIEKAMPNGKDKCLFVFIDTAPLIDKYRESKSYSDAGMQDLEKQLKWMDSTLTVSTDRWKIVIGHHPVYADTDKSKSERTDMQERVGKILENRKADLYICGHIHDFQHIRPDGKTVNYVVNSSASSSRKPKPIDGTLFCSGDPGITLCSVDEKNFTFYFINHKGETLYHYTLSK